MGSDDKGKGNGNDDAGGFVVGGIGFGTTSSKSEPSAGPVDLTDALMPLRVLAVVDLLPAGSFNAGAHPPETPVRVEPGNFDALFTKLKPKAALEVENVLLEGAKKRIDFAPVAMKSFRPDGLVEAIPLLRSLLDGRRVLEQLRDGTQTVEGATTELNRLWDHSSLVGRVLGGVELKSTSAPRPAPAPAADVSADVNAILDMVDTGTAANADQPAAAAAPAAPATAPAPAPSAGEGRFGAFIAAVAHSGKGRPGANPSEGIRIVERAFSVQLGAIVQHPEFRRLERAWRGLAFLTSRTPKANTTLEVLCARQHAIADGLASAIAPAAGPPVSFAVVDTDIGGDAASLATLRALAELGEQNATCVITNATASLFGRDDLDAIDRMDNKQSLFDDPARAPWRAEANRPAALWISLALNRVLSREAYKGRTTRIREASVEELPSDPNEATVWMSPCWAVASLATRCFEKHGWPCGITGPREGGLVENLPVRQTEVAGETIAVPTEAFFSTETQRALARIGVLALASEPNNDACYLTRAATAYVPPPKRTQDYDTAEDQVRLPQASLVDQLFVSRLAQYLQMLGPRISSSETAADIEKFLEAAVWELFKSAPNASEVAVSVTDDGRRQAAVTVRPRRFLGVSMEEITLGVPLA